MRAGRDNGPSLPALLRSVFWRGNLRDQRDELAGGGDRKCNVASHRSGVPTTEGHWGRDSLPSAAEVVVGELAILNLHPNLNSDCVNLHVDSVNFASQLL